MNQQCFKFIKKEDLNFLKEPFLKYLFYIFNHQVQLLETDHFRTDLENLLILNFFKYPKLAL